MISIIIPVFNAEHTIIETLLSIKKQTFQDYEVLIINDGSTDNTQSLILDFISKQSSPERWLLFNQSNTGVSQARNAGIVHCTGEYLFFCDADDILPTDALYYLYYYSNAGEYDLVVGGYEYIYKSGKKKYYLYGDELIDSKVAIKRFLLRELSIGIGNTLFKRTIMVKNNLKFEKYKYGEDHNFCCKVLCDSNQVRVIPNVVYYYMQNPTSAMNAKFSWQRLDSIIALDNSKSMIQVKYGEDCIYLLDIEIVIEVFSICTLYLRSNISEMSSLFLSENVDKILKFLPLGISYKTFFQRTNTKRNLLLLLFYKFPTVVLSLYKLYYFLYRANKNNA